MLGLKHISQQEKRKFAHGPLERVGKHHVAGVIHTDLERGFIRAEVYRIPDLLDFRTEAFEISRKSVLKGKEYTVEDGDVMYFRFNV